MSNHIWVRAESRAHERRSPVTAAGVAALRAAGLRVTVEDSGQRILPIGDFAAAGAEIAPEFSWPNAPTDAIILGLKELPDDGTPLPHRHIMFGHAFKGQFSGARLLDRFRAGGGALYDLEYLVTEQGARVAAFGYWAGYAGAAVSVLAYGAQLQGGVCPAVHAFDNQDDMLAALRAALPADHAARAIVIGALGRVGRGAADLCEAIGIDVTKWDMAETASGGPFPEILNHDLFFNAILARPGTPIFAGPDALSAPRALRVIGDIACDPDSDYNPIPLYSEATSWETPVTRVADAPALDIMAIDNLPSLLPKESSEDFAEQLLTHLQTIGQNGLDDGVWARAYATFRQHCPA